MNWGLVDSVLGWEQSSQQHPVRCGERGVLLKYLDGATGLLNVTTGKSCKATEVFVCQPSMTRRQFFEKSGIKPSEGLDLDRPLLFQDYFKYKRNLTLSEDDELLEASLWIPPLPLPLRIPLPLSSPLAPAPTLTLAEVSCFHHRALRAFQLDKGMGGNASPGEEPAVAKSGSYQWVPVQRCSRHPLEKQTIEHIALLPVLRDALERALVYARLAQQLGLPDTVDSASHLAEVRMLVPVSSGLGACIRVCVCMTLILALGFNWRR